tara:strand:- start:6430 stop:7137 length:708 start_codon:yes stop_codon:yes gene_type:complete
MKKIILPLLMIFAFVLDAQSLLPTKYGLKVGVNISDFNSTSNDGVDKIKTDQSYGISGGFYMEIPLNDKWYLNPSLLYAQKGTTFDYNYIHDYNINNREERSSNNDLMLTYLELSPMITYKTPYKIALNFGPSFGYQISYEFNIVNDIGEDDGESFHEILPDAEYQEELIDLGLDVGLSYYLTDNLILNTNVNTGFLEIGNISKVTYTGTVNNDSRSNIYKLKNKVISFSVSYLF